MRLIIRSLSYLFLLLTVQACGAVDATVPRSCAGIALDRVAPVSLSVSPTTTAILDTIRLAPSVTLSATDSNDPLTQRTTNGHAKAIAHLRIYDHTLPSTVIPVQLLVIGVSEGTDTLVVSTTIHGADCLDGATQRIALTVR